MKRSEGAAKVQLDEEVKKFNLKNPEFNPFLVEPILVKLLKLVDTVLELKEYRKMCQTWDKFNLKELEDRAFDGKLKAIDFQWTNKFDKKSEAEANLVQFMGDTLDIPRLFSSFKFNFPVSWTIFSKHMEFFSIYPVTFVHLAIPRSVEALEQTGVLLKEFMESESWGNLKEITVSLIDGKIGLPSSFPFVPSGNIDKKLQKLDIKINSPPILEIFESAFASGKYKNVISMGLSVLPSGNLEFPGLDLNKLTRLKIGQIGYGSLPALKFTSGLMNLVENGMTLKYFGVNINVTPKWSLDLDIDEFFFENLRIICSNLTQFFSSQSSTLERLAFGFICHLKVLVNLPEGIEIWCKIHLPEFEVLHSIKLGVDFKLIDAVSRKTHAQLFGMTQNVSVPFFKLVNHLVCMGRLKLNPAADGAGQFLVNRLEIPDNDDLNFRSTSFVGIIGSVEEFHCPARLLYEELFPSSWGESLRSLYIDDIQGNEKVETFKLKRFKNLERLVTKYNAVYEIDRLIQDVDLSCYRKVEDYLATFKEATELPLTSITFIGPNMEEELKEEFINYFPFPVEFKISL